MSQDKKQPGRILLADRMRAIAPRYVNSGSDVYGARYVVKQLENAPVVLADNVAEYLTETKMRGNKHFDFYHAFPTVRPPFDVFWCEYKSSGIQNLGFDRAGFLFRTFEYDSIDIPIMEWIAYQSNIGFAEERNLSVSETLQATNFISDFLADRQLFKWRTDHKENWKPPSDLPPKWITIATQCVGAEFDKNNNRCPWYWVVAAQCTFITDANGVFAGPAYFNMTGTIGELNRQNVQSPEKKQALQTELMFSIAPAFMAISFMHCKNVSQVETLPPPSLEKAFRKKHQGPPMVKYKMLAIDPNMTGSGSHKSTGEGGKRSFHIRRGNFANYDEENKLFGRFVGRYWRPSARIGSKEHGEVIKTYDVKALQESPQETTSTTN